MVMTLVDVSLLHAVQCPVNHTPMIFVSWSAREFLREVFFCLHNNCWKPHNGPYLSHDEGSRRIDQDIADEELEKVSCLHLLDGADWLTIMVRIEYRLLPVSPRSVPMPAMLAWIGTN